MLLGEVVNLNNFVVDQLESDSGVGVEMVASLRIHNLIVKIANLVILAVLAFVPEVRLAGDDIVGELVRRLGRVVGTCV